MDDREARSGAWEGAYAGEPPPWDTGAPQPAIVALADQPGAIGKLVLDVGCGTGENVLFLSASGRDAIGVDLSPTAIARARAKADRRSLGARFAVHDALDLASLGETFDTVVDCGCYHTFDPMDHAAYVRSVAAVVVPGGRLHVLAFSEFEPPGWGPRRVPRDEFARVFAEGWRVDAIRPARFETRLEGHGAAAWLATMTRLADDEEPRSASQGRTEGRAVR